MAKIAKTNPRQVISVDGVIDRNLSIMLNNIADWINENSQSGTTAQRPTDNLYNGRRYIDTTLVMEITYISGAWRRYDGTAV